jgi:multidrug efflux pump subunit AcrB
MQFVLFALRRPISLMVAIVAVVLGGVMAIQRMKVDIFPQLNLPVIYVCQPYGGMDPSQMEGYLTNYYEYHFLYISGIHHVESKNIQGLALMKLYFHPGTDMSQAMAETINYVNRSQAFMPPGTVSPFVMRFDTGSVPVGRLVLSSETRSIAEIQDLALFRVRPMFAALPGVSAPPPFGGAQRTVVVTVDPERLKAYDLSAEKLVEALGNGNRLTPSGNLVDGDKYPIVPVNSVVKNVKDLENIPIPVKNNDTVYIGDVATVQDFMDAPTGYALVNGRRAVYILATKRADASTVDVVNRIKAAIPEMQKVLPPDIKVSYELDQSPFVLRAVEGVAIEGALGALLVGLLILLFLRDWRSSLVVVLNIPLALMSAVLALWLTGQTINVMTLGGLALAIGILVDESTVAIENIHAHLERGKPLAVAVRDGTAETAIPRFLAMVCILAVFVSTFFMEGAARGLFVPLALAVGFSMFASYILSSTFVPVLSVWLLRRQTAHVPGHAPAFFSFENLRHGFERALGRVMRFRIGLVVIYLLVCALLVSGLGMRLGTDIFPVAEAGEFRVRMRAPDGTHIGKTEEIAKQVLKRIDDEVGKENVKLTLGYLGTVPSSYPINGVFHWSGGPEEATFWVELKHGTGISTDELKERLRQKFQQEFPDVRFSLEPSDIVNEVMSFGSRTPIEVAVSGPNFQDNLAYARKLEKEMAKIPALRDLQYGQSLDYPTIDVNVDHKKAWKSNRVTVAGVSKSLVPATSSSRFLTPLFWADPKSGIGYQVQVEIPRPVIRDVNGYKAVTSAKDLANLPVQTLGAGSVPLNAVAEIKPGTMPGQFDRYNMRREVSLLANIVGEDLGGVSAQVSAALARAGEPPRGAKVEVRGQIPPMQNILTGLATGLILSVVVIFLLLTANFQSLRLALVTVSTAPAAITGVVLMLWLTGTTLNIQSFVGSIMAIGVAMANAILLVTFAESRRRHGDAAPDAAVTGAGSRLRAILMTSCAMIAGMIPMALGFGETGQQNAPLGRAVIGGLACATLATLFVLPCMFALVKKNESASLDPGDPNSLHFVPENENQNPQAEPGVN